MSFLNEFYNHLVEKNVCFTSFVFLLSFLAVSVMCLFLAVQWVGLWSVIVVFSGHTCFWNLYRYKHYAMRCIKIMLMYFTSSGIIFSDIFFYI